MEEVKVQESTEKTEKEKIADNPKGHSIEFLATNAAQIRWTKHTAKSKVATGLEISTQLLDDVNSSPEYRDAVKDLMVKSRTPAEAIKWIEKYGPEMPTRFGRRMGLEPEKAADLINEVVTEITPAANEEVKVLAEAKAAEKAAKEKEKADKAAEVKMKKDAAAEEKKAAAAKKTADAKAKTAKKAD